jgi:transposase
MLKKDSKETRKQVNMVCTDDLVPADHLLRLIDQAINFDFIYDLVEDKYSQNTGRPSLDPVTLIKIPLIQYLYGIKSMRQTIKEIEVNVAYKWFLGLDFYDKVPHFSTFGKNYKRRFEGTDIFEQIFAKILEQCFKHDFVDTSVAFIDATHIKARANRHKSIKKAVRKEALFYEKELESEISKDRHDHGKKALKDKKDDDDQNGGNHASNKKQVTQSTSDPESGLFHKGDHKMVFAYSAQTACDKNGWITAYSIHPGNEHDSRTFPEIYQKVKTLGIKKAVMDAGYKTPPIARQLIEDDIIPILPYKRNPTKKGFFFKKDYLYDEYYDCYICPNNQTLKYATTNRDGYREYKSSGKQCSHCPDLTQCTHSKNHVKVITRHVWQTYIDQCEEYRFDIDHRKLYQKRKETIERIFGTAKENHGLRYTQYVGKALMNMKVGLTFACMNMKKLAMILHKKGKLSQNLSFSLIFCMAF